MYVKYKLAKKKLRKITSYLEGLPEDKQDPASRGTTCNVLNRK